LILLHKKIKQMSEHLHIWLQMNDAKAPH
jgi:hypothetical protein